MRTPRGPASKLAALALGTLIAVTLAEGIARFAERHTAGRDAAAAADTRDRRPPTKRFPEPQAERGDLRILVIGDSFTVGGVYAVEETFPGRLQELLDGRLGAVSFEVLTLASSGWNTEEEFQQARPFVKALAPDLILVGVCLNDPEPSDQALVRRHFSEAGLSDSQSSEGWWPYRASAAVRLGVDGYRAWRSRPAVRRYYRSFYSEELPSWQAFRHALERFRHLARKQRAPLVLAVFPIFDSPLDRRYPYRDLHAKIGDTAREKGIRSLDLLSAYEGMDFRSLQVAPADPHPSALAHRLAAERIFEYLEAEGLLSGRQRR